MTLGETRSTSDCEELEKLITKVCTSLINQIEERIISKLSKLETIISSFSERVRP